MSVIKKNNKYLNYDDYEPPAKKIISEGDILIKDLANKQRNHKITLQEYLQKQQNFEKTSEQISFTSCCSGALSLQKFQLVLEKLEHVEELKSCDLSNDDVKLILDFKDNNVSEKYKNMEPNILQERIKEISQVISKCKEKYDEEIGDAKGKNISRKQHEALVIKPNSTETKLLKFALENKRNCIEKLPHPMDNIKCIEESLFSHLDEKEMIPSKVQKRIRRYANKINAIASPDAHGLINTGTVSKSAHSFATKSKWDQNSDEYKSVPTNTPVKEYTCKFQNYFTIQNGQIVKLNRSDTKKINITKCRLSVEEIRNIPRFKDYVVGVPSNKLFLKNLPKQIEETDLHRIFAEFTNNSTLLFRLMSGRMKGQAFVTFPDVEAASNALNTINGMSLNGQPLIIEFGKSKDT